MAKNPISRANAAFRCKTGLRCRPGLFWLGGLLLVSLLLVSPVLAQSSTRYTSKRLESPRATLNQPFDAPIFLGGYGQFGGGFDYDQGQPGYGGIIMFRPGSAANFLPFLYDWNSSLVLQVDYQKVSSTSRILSGDLIIRHYFDDMRDPHTKVSTFVGGGVGGSEVILPPGADKSHDQYWSFLVEFGQEWNYPERCIIFVKGQFRYYNYGGYNFSTWSVQAGFGFPLPW